MYMQVHKIHYGNCPTKLPDLEHQEYYGILCSHNVDSRLYHILSLMQYTCGIVFTRSEDHLF